MKDLSQMMDGMLDLNRRNQLPDRERAICLKLLLRITLKVEGARGQAICVVRCDAFILILISIHH